MGIWETLGIEQTRDTAAIKRAYAEKAREHHPEDDPGGFAALHQAYKMALASAELGAEGPPDDVAQPAPEETRPPRPAPASYPFEALDGHLEKNRQQQAARMEVFFRAADALYDDMVARYSIGEWQALLAAPQTEALLGSGAFVARFVAVFTGYDLPEDVREQALLPFVRQWRSRWLGTPQWTLFNRIEDPVAQVRQAEHHRADDFIRALDAVYQNRKNRGDPAAWRAVFALPQFDEMQGEAYFNRVFARFIMNRREIPQNIWDEVLQPLMENWRATWEGNPLWVSFAWAQEKSRKRKSPFARLRGSGRPPRGGAGRVVALCVMVVLAVAILAAVVFLVVRWQDEKANSAAGSIPAYNPATPPQGAATVAEALALSYDDWAALSEEEARQREVIGAISGKKSYHEVTEAATALGITVEDYDTMARVSTPEDAASLGAKVKAYHPVATAIITEKVAPRIRAGITGESTGYSDIFWLCHAVGMESDDFDALRIGWAEKGDPWLDARLAEYSGFAMSMTMMQMPLPDDEGNSAGNAAQT